MESHRPIRSFVLRQGRSSNAQSRAYKALLPEYSLAYQEDFLNLDAVFNRTAPRVLEIGFGMGETTARIASQHPETDYIGIEVHSPGIGSLLIKIEEGGLKNVRIIQHDAVAVLTHMIAPLSLDGIHIYFPDPWPKTRHHKRRLIQPDFITQLCTKLKGGGVLHIATDWADYAKHITTVLGNELQLTSALELSCASRPRTKFEQRGLDLGHKIYEWVFQKHGN